MPTNNEIDYSDEVYQVILERMLASIQRYNPELDVTRPSSPIYLALVPAAMELAKLYHELEIFYTEIYFHSASREYLIKFGRDFGLSPYPASYAILEGEFDLPIKIGDSFTYNQELTYTVIEPIDETGPTYFYKLQCLTPGTIGNTGLGVLKSTYYITNLTLARTTRVIKPGEDEESTESFRDRLMAIWKAGRYGGNLPDYYAWLTEIDGVGRAKILRCQKDGELKKGAVEIYITSSDNTVPSQELIDSVQEIIRPLEIPGYPDIDTCGTGKSPICHESYIKGAKAHTIDVHLNIVYLPGYTWENVRESVIEAIESYFKQLAGEWGWVEYSTAACDPKSAKTVVRASRIELRLLEIPGIDDYGDTFINGVEESFTLEWDEIPVLGEVSDG